MSGQYAEQQKGDMKDSSVTNSQDGANATHWGTPRTDAFWRTLNMGLVPLASPTSLLLEMCRKLEREANEAASALTTLTQELLDARSALALNAEDEAGLNELLRDARRMLSEPSDEAIVNGMEASVLGRASVDDDTYVLSIYRAMTREAIEAIGRRYGDTTVPVANGGASTTASGTPVDEYGVAHHGAPILTQRDYDYCVAMVKWIATARASGGFGYGPDWLPTDVDIIKSRLFWRLRAGQKPLQHRPPTCYSCPWYEVVEELTPHWTMECWTTGQNALYPKPMAIIGQCSYGIEAIDHSDGSLKVVTFGPWRFKVWVGEHPNNPKTSGWYIQRIPQEEVDGTAPETSTRSADE